MRIWSLVLFATALQACAASAPGLVTPSAVTATASITAADGRTVPILTVPATRARGVILVSHGGQSDPATMLPVMRHLAQNGFVAIAPTHTDSQAMTPDGRTDLAGALVTRIDDLQAVAEYASKAYPELPMALFGYSYGSLTALMGGGAFAPAIPGKIAGARAVVMFSSPGPIPGLSEMPGALASVDVPTLLVTGTADTVPGFVPDPALHLTYFDGLPPGDHTVFIVKDATHGFVRGERGMEVVAPLALDFLKSRVLGDPDAGKRFDMVRTTESVEVRRR